MLGCETTTNSHAFTLTHAHLQTHTRPGSLTYSHTFTYIPLIDIHSQAGRLTSTLHIFTDIHSHTLTMIHSHTHMHSHTLTHTLRHAFTHVHTLTHIHRHSVMHSYTLSHTPTHTQSYTHTHSGGWEIVQFIKALGTGPCGQGYESRSLP